MPSLAYRLAEIALLESADKVVDGQEPVEIERTENAALAPSGLPEILSWHASLHIAICLRDPYYVLGFVQKGAKGEYGIRFRYGIREIGQDFFVDPQTKVDRILLLDRDEIAFPLESQLLLHDRKGIFKRTPLDVVYYEKREEP